MPGAGPICIGGGSTSFENTDAPRSCDKGIQRSYRSRKAHTYIAILVNDLELYDLLAAFGNALGQPLRRTDNSADYVPSCQLLFVRPALMEFGIQALWILKVAMLLFLIRL
jgi:hypothetical protein